MHWLKKSISWWEKWARRSRATAEPILISVKLIVNQNALKRMRFSNKSPAPPTLSWFVLSSLHPLRSQRRNTNHSDCAAELLLIAFEWRLIIKMLADKKKMDAPRCLRWMDGRTHLQEDQLHSPALTPDVAAVGGYRRQLGWSWFSQQSNQINWFNWQQH